MHLLASLFGYYKPIPKGSTALITGGSHGIGASIAHELGRRGCNLILVGRDQQALNAIQQQLVKDYRIKVATIRQDLGQVNAADQVYSELLKLNMKIDIIVNNAGLAHVAPFVEQDPKQIEEVVLTNDLAPLKLTRLLLPQLIERKNGWILNVSSIAGFLPGPGNAVYHASKSFLTTWSYSLAYELKNDNITVSTLTPGPVYETEIGKRSGIDNAWGLIFSPGHLPQSIAQLAIEGLERGDMLIIAKRHIVAAIAVKILPATITVRVGQLFNTSPVPDWIKSWRFSVARTIGV